MVRQLSIVFAVAAAFALPATPAVAQTPVQNPTTSSYSFFWSLATDNVSVSSASVNQGSTITLRFWLKEAAGGNALSSNNALGNGLAAYDMNLGWSNTSVLQLPSSGAANTVNTNASPNVYANGAGWTGPGGLRNGTQTTNANANGTASWAHSNISTNDSTNWVDAASTFTTSGGNFVGGDGSNNVLLTQITFMATAEGLATVTGSQMLTGAPNFTYARQDLTGTGTPITSLQLDSLIGNTNAAIQITVTPVPEPTGLLALTALTLAGWKVRRTARRRANEAKSVA